MSRQGSARTARPIHSRRVARAAPVSGWAVEVMASSWTPRPRALHVKLPECRQQGLAAFGGDRLATQSVQVARDVTHLVQVLDAEVALAEVGLEAATLGVRDRDHEEVGHPLEEILAGH